VEAVGEQPRADSASTHGNGAPARVCPHFHAAIELIGRRWSGAILWALGESPHYFAEITAAVPGLSDRLLSRRLRELEAAKRLLLYCVGVDGADFGVLREIAPDATYDCDVRFDKLAAMLSASMASGASSADTKDVYDTVASALAGLGVERR